MAFESLALEWLERGYTTILVAIGPVILEKIFQKLTVFSLICKISFQEMDLEFQVNHLDSPKQSCLVLCLINIGKKVLLKMFVRFVVVFSLFL